MAFPDILEVVDEHPYRIPEGNLRLIHYIQPTQELHHFQEIINCLVGQITPPPEEMSTLKEEFRQSVLENTSFQDNLIQSEKRNEDLKFQLSHSEPANPVNNSQQANDDNYQNLITEFQATQKKFEDENKRLNTENGQLKKKFWKADVPAKIGLGRGILENVLGDKVCGIGHGSVANMQMNDVGVSVSLKDGKKKNSSSSNENPRGTGSQGHVRGGNGRTEGRGHGSSDHFRNDSSRNDSSRNDSSRNDSSRNDSSRNDRKPNKHTNGSAGDGLDRAAADENTSGRDFGQGRGKPEEYIPPAPSDKEEDIFSGAVPKGTNFDKYNDIPVEISGRDQCGLISSFDDADLHPIQKYSIPVVNAGRDLMACAQTGSGKALFTKRLKKRRFPIDAYSIYNGHLIVVGWLPPNTSTDFDVHLYRTLEETLRIIGYSPTQELRHLQELIDCQAQQITIQHKEISRLNEALKRSCKAEQLDLLQQIISRLNEKLRRSDQEITCLRDNVIQSEKRNEDLKFQLSHWEPANSVNNSQQANDDNYQNLITELQATQKKLQKENSQLKRENGELEKKFWNIQQDFEDIAQQAVMSTTLHGIYKGYIITMTPLHPRISADIPIHPGWTLEEMLRIILYDPTTQDLHRLQELRDCKDVQIALLQEEISALKKELERSCSTEINQYAVNYSQQAIDSNLKQIKELIAKENNSQDEIKRLNTENTKLTKQLQEELRDCKDQQIALLQEEISVTKELEISCRAEISHLQQKISHLQQKISMLHEELRRSHLEITCLEEHLKESEKRNENLHLKLQSSHSEPANAVNNSIPIDNYRKQPKELKATKQKLQDEIKQLKTGN